MIASELEAALGQLLNVVGLPSEGPNVALINAALDRAQAALGVCDSARRGSRDAQASLQDVDRVRALLAAEVGEVPPCAACGNADPEVPRALCLGAGARRSACLDGQGCLARQSGRPIKTYHELIQHFEDLGSEPCSECDWSLNEIRDYVNIVVAAKEVVKLIAGAQKAGSELVAAVAALEVTSRARSARLADEDAVAEVAEGSTTPLNPNMIECPECGAAADALCMDADGENPRDCHEKRLGAAGWPGKSETE